MPLNRSFDQSAKSGWKLLKAAKQTGDLAGAVPTESCLTHLALHASQPSCQRRVPTNRISGKSVNISGVNCPTRYRSGTAGFAGQAGWPGACCFPVRLAATGDGVWRIRVNRLFSAERRCGLTLSHSGDTIALLLSDEGEVGCILK